MASALRQLTPQKPVCAAVEEDRSVLELLASAALSTSVLLAGHLGFAATPCVFWP
jgi:hypothetical protein